MATVVTHGSGNVFADLGLPDPEVRLAKADLAIAIRRAIDAGRMSRAQAMRATGLDAAGLDRLSRGLLDDLSVDRLRRIADGLRIEGGRGR